MVLYIYFMVWLNIWIDTKHLLKALTHQGYDVIRHNHRGHGKEIDEKERDITTA